MKLRFILVAFLLVAFAPPFTSGVRAQELRTEKSPADLLALFQEGVTAYQRAEFPEAVRSFEEIRHSGFTQAALDYNLGNAYFRSAKLGQAIASYLRALHRDPRNSDLRYNLQFARGKSVDKIEPNQWQSVKESLTGWIMILTPREWFWLFFTCHTFFWLLAVWWVFRGKKGPELRVALGVFLCLALSTAMLAASQSILRPEIGVVTEAEVTVHSGPNPSNTELFRLHEGTEFVITDEEGGWVRLQLVDGKQGWLDARSLERV